jgi:beta-lactamase regulating signal transducer with metallopeptidase domain
MMTFFIRFYPGDRFIEFWLVVGLVVTIVSIGTWFVSRRLARQAALRRLVLHTALVACLAAPAIVGICFLTGFELASIRLLGEGTRQHVIAAKPMESDGESATVPQHANTQPMASESPLPVRVSSSEPKTKKAVTLDSKQPPASMPPIEAVAPARENSAEIRQSGRGLATLGLFLWAAVGALMLVRLAWSCWRVVQLRRLSRPIKDERIREMLSDVCRQFNRRHLPLLLVSDRTVTPLAAGFGQPAIILPERLMGAIGDDELRDILIHETAHLVHGDQRVVLLQGLAGAMYWPIVSVHALNRELQRAREEHCDNAVLAYRDAVSYGETLLHIAELSLSVRPIRATVGIMHWRGKLERRIAGLIDPCRSRRMRPGWKVACIVMCLFALAVGAASATRLTTDAGDAGINGGGSIDDKASKPSAAPVAADVSKKATRARHRSKDSSDPHDPAQAGHFSGQVSGPDGKPFKGARVYMLPVAVYPGSIKVDSKGIGPVRAETSADGRFEFDAPDMTYAEFDGLPARLEGLLIVTAEGYAPDWMHTWGQMTGFTLREDWMPVKGTPLDMHLAKDDVPIHGRLLGPDGKPLAGARVKLHMLMVPRNRDLDAHLAHESKLDAHAYFLSSGPSFERKLYWKFVPLVPGLPTEVRTDEDGRFRMSGLGRDRLAELAVSAPGVLDTEVTVMTRDVPDVGTLLDFKKKPTQIIYGAGFTLKLEPGRTIRGVVRDRDSHQPLKGMWVAQYNQNAEATADWYRFVTDEQGRFAITGQYFSKDKFVVAAIAPPGVPYDTAGAAVDGNGEAIIECPRGIPFRLKLVNEQRKPVEAEITHIELNPNPNDVSRVPDTHPSPWQKYTPAARRADGTYEGFVLPGPGAVLIKTARRLGYRQARVDPKAFFAPGKTNWTPKEQETLYGTEETLFGTSGKYDQRDYTAIVLVNPPPDSKPLDLSATLVRDPVRYVSLVDPDGKPVVGASMKTSDDWWEPHLRAATFPLLKLHPDRSRRILFTKQDRKLVGLLTQQGAGAEPYTVRMQPWGTITGRLVDHNGEPLPIFKPESDVKAPPYVDADIVGDKEFGHRSAQANAKGRFRIDQLIPGQNYSGRTYCYMEGNSEPIFKDVILSSGEVRDLGDIRTKLSYEPNYRRPGEEDKKATANVPAEAWGKPVNGLRVAIVLKSPAVITNGARAPYVQYGVVAENVSDHDIRFGAGDHYEYGFNKTHLIDADGNEVARQAGERPGWVDTLPRIRIWLKPKERVLIAERGARLVQVNDAGQPLKPRRRGELYHYFNVKPGRYSIYAAVVLGSGIDYPDPRSGPRELNFAAKGEWAGELRTGTVAVSLFEEAGK